MVLSFYCISHFIDIILDIFTRFTTVLGNFVCYKGSMVHLVPGCPARLVLMFVLFHCLMC